MNYTLLTINSVKYVFCVDMVIITIYILIITMARKKQLTKKGEIVCYNIYMLDPKTNEIIYLDNSPFFEMGTYTMYGVGSDEAWVSITRNYAPFYHQTINQDSGIRWIYERTGAEVLPIIVSAIQKLGTDRDKNYWKATPGNAGHALLAIAWLCRAYPDGIFTGD